MINHIPKKLGVTCILLGLLATLLSACTPGSPAAEGSDPTINIAIIQYMSHPSLDAARAGFLDALQVNGYEAGKQINVVVRNAEGDAPTNQAIAQQFAEDGYDLILAIATPSAQAMANATQDIPILITAITDPVAAKLVASMEQPHGNVTGTSDYVSIAEQLSMVQQIMPGLKRLGVIYNNGEENSLVQIDVVKEYASANGLTVVEATPTNSNEVLQAAQSLSGKVDAIYVPTDNTVVAAIDAVVKVSYEEQIPLFPAEGDSVAKGGVATAGVNYYQLGEQTGRQAVRILQGASPAEIAVETQPEKSVIVNLLAAEKVGIVIPAAILEQAVTIIEE